MTTELEERVRKHGDQLLRIFVNAIERDPVKLCKKLRHLETKMAAFALQLCNGHNLTEDEEDKFKDGILSKLDALLGFSKSKVPVFLNLDPRGYSLKIEDEFVRSNSVEIHRDWGGYGILAPDLRD